MKASTYALLLPLLLLPSLLSAAPPVQAGPVLKVGAGSGPRLAVFPDGGFVVVWDTASTLHARIFDDKGVPTTGELAILRPAGQSVDSVAALPNGFVVVWEQARFSVYSVFARIFDRTGVPLGPPFKVHRTSLNSRCCAQVAAAPDGGFAIAWLAFVNTNHTPGHTSWVLRRFFDPTGKPLGPEPQEPMIPNLFPQDPTWLEALTATPDGGLLHLASVDVDVPYLYVGQGAGSHQGGSNLFESTADDAAGFLPSFTSGSLRADGGAVIAWQSDPFFVSHPTSDIYAQRFQATGSPAGNGPLKMNVRSGVELSPVVTTLPDGGFAALWAEVRNVEDPAPLGIFGRFFNVNGRAATQEFALGAPGASYQYGYTLAAGARGDVVAAWSQQRTGGGGAGVYVRVLRTGSP